MAKIRGVAGILSCVFAVLGVCLSCTIVWLGSMGDMNEFYILGYLLLTLLASFLMVGRYIPKKSYFTTEALSRDIEKKIYKKQRSSKK